eukprot:scaffold19932_cov107-Amphora_coffeaeformis.AAC.1
MKPDGSKVKPEDLPPWDWHRNAPIPGTDNPFPVDYTIAPNGDIKKPDGRVVKPEEYPGWDWSRNRPIPGSKGPAPIEYEVGPK